MKSSKRMRQMFARLRVNKPWATSRIEPCIIDNQIKLGKKWFWNSGVETYDWTATKRQAVIGWLLGRQRAP